MFKELSRKLTSSDFISKAVVGFGLSKMARASCDGQGCVLTFHGVRDHSAPSRILDENLHITQTMFRAVCEHLAANYRVVPLAEISTACVERRPMPAGTVAITFDDGYESNYKLAYPVLKELGLPATIFATTGFLDGTHKLWFNRLELAVDMTKCGLLELEIGGKSYSFSLNGKQSRAAALESLLAAVKMQPQAVVPELLDGILAAMEVEPFGYERYPVPLLPMSWDQAREMRDSGLIDIGGHTHSHPILGRCTCEKAREEIFLSKERMIKELGAAPTQFAYTNGKLDDYNVRTKELLREAGYQAAYTMLPGFINPGDDAFALPRYGTPNSIAQAESTVSGTFETLHRIKKACLEALAI